MSAEADAAVREGGGASSSLDFEGLGFTLTLPSKLPFRVLRSLGENKDSEPAQVVAMLSDILGEEQAEKVWASDLDLDAGRELVEKLLAQYGIGSGGIRSLAELLDRRWRFVEADFQRYYGLDLGAETERGCRRLWALVSALPVEAATWREGKPQWTVADELAAQAIERADVWGRMIFRGVAALGGTKVSDSKLPKPPQINHPGRTAARAEKKQPERDPRVIREWFRRNLGGR